MSKRKIEPGTRDQVVNLYDGDELADIRYGRWRDAKDGRYLVPAYLSGSDYSGSLVERANHRAWSEKFASGEDTWWTNAPGGHGTFAVVIDMDGVPEEDAEEVAEFIGGLEDYPLADEDLHSEMEMEAQSEAWDNWARSDFKRALEKKFNVELDEVDDEKVFELFQEKADESNTYWENEQGDSMYINLDRIIKKISKNDVKELLG